MTTETRTIRVERALARVTRDAITSRVRLTFTERRRFFLQHVFTVSGPSDVIDAVLAEIRDAEDDLRRETQIY